MQFRKLYYCKIIIIHQLQNFDSYSTTFR